MKILVIEDDLQLNITMQRLLVEWGHTTMGAENLDDARGILQKRRIDCLVLDLQLPDGSGLEVVEELRANEKEIPFILVTGTGDLSQSAEAVELGVTGIIVKPFIYDTLFENICKVQTQIQREPILPLVEENYWHTYVVALMQAAVRCWSQETGTGIAALGERSGAWTVTINKDTARARTLERYLKIDNLPHRPKLGPVIQTAEYLLEQFPDSEYASEIRLQVELLKLKAQEFPIRRRRKKKKNPFLLDDYR